MVLRLADKRKFSVRDRIFHMNALMILVTTVLCGMIGAVFLKIYWEKEERTIRQLIGTKLQGAAGDELVKSLTVHNGWFNGMLLLFAVLCVITLIAVSRFFTVLLSNHVMEPLELLEEGAGRIRENDLSNPVCYQGDREFEEVCEAFNAMQQHLKDEKEKNSHYEKARQEMIAGISHDLRSPLTAVRGAVKGVLDGVASDPVQQKRFLEAAYRRSGEMAQLLEELFYFSRLETGGIPVCPRPMELTEYLRNFIRGRQESPEMDGVRFCSRIPEQPLPQVMADPEALERILTNILTNSRKYAMSSPLKIFISVQRAGNGWQRILVQDNGVGVPENQLGRIFEEFYRGDESRGGKEGSGLGLYVVKYLCEAMGGRVSADTEQHERDFHGLAVVIELREEEPEEYAEKGQNSDH